MKLVLFIKGDNECVAFNFDKHMVKHIALRFNNKLAGITLRYSNVTPTAQFNFCEIANIAYIAFDFIAHRPNSITSFWSTIESYGHVRENVQNWRISKSPVVV